MFDNLKWNELDCCYECMNCGARYGEEEVARLKGYDADAEFDTEGFCMDCGCEWRLIYE